MRAVRPLVPHRSTLAPRCSSSFATCSCPPAAAPCSSPFPFSASASTRPPFCSQPTTGCSSPRHAASPTLSGSDMSTLQPSYVSVAIGYGQLQRRAAVPAAQLGAGPSL
eukprot:scaffold23492_cov65-Phaeocystis_antarctica.AAC.5